MTNNPITSSNSPIPICGVLGTAQQTDGSAAIISGNTLLNQPPEVAKQLFSALLAQQISEAASPIMDTLSSIPQNTNENTAMPPLAINPGMQFTPTDTLKKPVGSVDSFLAQMTFRQVDVPVAEQPRATPSDPGKPLQDTPQSIVHKIPNPSPAIDAGNPSATLPSPVIFQQPDVPIATQPRATPSDPGKPLQDAPQSIVHKIPNPSPVIDAGNPSATLPSPVIFQQPDVPVAAQPRATPSEPDKPLKEASIKATVQNISNQNSAVDAGNPSATLPSPVIFQQPDVPIAAQPRATPSDPGKPLQNTPINPTLCDSKHFPHAPQHATHDLAEMPVSPKQATPIRSEFTLPVVASKTNTPVSQNNVPARGNSNIEPLLNKHEKGVAEITSMYTTLPSSPFASRADGKNEPINNAISPITTAPETAADAASLQTTIVSPPMPNPASSTPAYAVSAPLGTVGWETEFSQKVIWISTQDNQAAELHLNPPDLGPINVILKITDNQLSAQFVSPHSLVRDAVENSLHKLREVLAESNIMLGNATVSDQPPREQHAWESSAQNPSGKGSQNHAPGDAPDPNKLNVSTPKIAGIRRHNGMLDTFA